METEAFVVEKPNAPFKLTSIILDDIREDEFLIEMKYSGICHTDLTFQANQLPGLCDPPAIYGHEGAGIVRGIGSKVYHKDIRIGDPVLLSVNFCRTCKQCTAGHPGHCNRGAELNFPGLRANGSKSKSKSDSTPIRSQFFGHSSFSKFSLVKEACVVKFPGSAEEMGIFAACGCSFQTGAGTVMKVLQPKPEDSVVVLGGGSVGLAAVMAAKCLGVHQIVVVDLLGGRLDLAKELGATAVVKTTGKNDFVGRIKKMTEGGATFCVDCTGVPKVIESMVDCIAPYGTAVSLGIPPAGAKISLDPVPFIFENKRYIGVTGGDTVPSFFIPKLIDLQRNGHFPVERICTVYPYSKIETAIADMRQGKTIKPVIQWS